MRRTALTCVLALALAGTAGCAGSDDDGTAAPSTAPTSAAPTSTGAGTVDLRALSGDRWSQGSLALEVGQTVVVTNADPDGAHNFVVAGVGQSETMQPGDVFRLTFPKAGTFDFVCTFHPGMEGKVTVS